jgi:hypothetical protein
MTYLPKFYQSFITGCPSLYPILCSRLVVLRIRQLQDHASKPKAFLTISELAKNTIKTNLEGFPTIRNSQLTTFYVLRLRFEASNEINVLFHTRNLLATATRRIW